MTADKKPLGQEKLHAHADLAAVADARRVAVENTRRPAWLLAAFALAFGTAFGFAMLRSPLGWTVGIVVFVLGVLGFLVADSRMKRRRGRLLQTGFRMGSGLRFMALYATIFLVGLIQPPAAWQPWFAVVAGAVVGLAGYLYLRWDDAATAKRLATGDFDPDDLMP